jgi:hypothetical protein
MKWIVISVALLSGCATEQQHTGRLTGDPLRPVYVDCSKAVTTVNDMQRIIANPDKSDPYWDNVFSTLNGNKTSRQRYSSAKTVYWSARTQCYYAL